MLFGKLRISGNLCVRCRHQQDQFRFLLVLQLLTRFPADIPQLSVRWRASLADQTNVTVQIFRNPTAENVLVAEQSVDFAAPIAGAISIPIAGVDALPDPRAVTYILMVQQSGGVDDGDLNGGAYLEATLISG